MISLDKRLRIDYLMVQPTSLCNLRCDYCYLPDRAKNNVIKIETANKVRLFIEKAKSKVNLIWHGGEPLTCGHNYLSELFELFTSSEINQYVNQCIQTNGTLIDNKWTEIFKKYRINVGTSIDGNEKQTASRKHKSGKPAYENIIHGIETLKQNNVSFSVICVISKDTIGKAEEIYNHLISLKPSVVAFNIEENEGTNERELPNANDVRMFWSSLYKAWSNNPVVPVREFSFVLPRLKHLAEDASWSDEHKIIDIFPCVNWNGDITLVSPEFFSAKNKQFIVGNINDDDLYTIVENATEVSFVQEHLDAAETCKNECEFYPVCGGGQASNKFFETGSILTTETQYCINTVKLLTEGILQAM